LENAHIENQSAYKVESVGVLTDTFSRMANRFEKSIGGLQPELSTCFVATELVLFCFKFSQEPSSKPHKASLVIAMCF